MKFFFPVVSFDDPTIYDNTTTYKKIEAGSNLITKNKALAHTVRIFFLNQNNINEFIM